MLQDKRTILSQISQPYRNIYIALRHYIPGGNVIIAVSDIHLGTTFSQEEAFERFLDEVIDETVEHVVLVGDILDMWRRDPSALLLEYGNILEKLRDLQTEERKIHYIVGNHDYHLIKLKDSILDRYNFKVSASITLSCGEEYYFIHGHQFEFPDSLDIYQKFADLLCLGDDMVGLSANELWKLIKIWSAAADIPKKWVIKNAAKILKSPEERFNEDEIDKINETIDQWREKNADQLNDKYIVYGHTHRGGVDGERRVGNTGSWVDDPSHPELEKNTYIAIEEGEPPVLKKYR